MIAAVVDFETAGIKSRPNYPPRPVGVAIKKPGQKGHYYAWGHPTGNNCTREEGARAVRAAMDGGEVVFHNSIFDVDVGEVHLNAPRPNVAHDTLFLAFLLEPEASTLSLKPLAERHLGLKPVERDAVKEWLRTHHPVLSKMRKQSFEKDWGAYICDAPGDLVGRYAIGDIDRTDRLFDKLYRKVVKEGMLAAYEREVALMPITLEMERTGVRVDVKRLQRDKPVFEAELAAVAKRIYKILGRTFNIASNEELFESLYKANKLSAIVKTEKGNPSTAIKVLHETCNDKALLMELSLHSTLENYLGTFINRWIEEGSRNHGYVHPSFNQVRDRSGEGRGGTRTGRYSSNNPNFQNLPADVEEAKNRDVLIELASRLRKRGLEFVGLRDYILPDPGCAFVSADYSQQEPRILAHFERGRLMRAYQEDPKLDVHAYAAQLIKEATGIEYPRKYVKVIALGLMYGMGLDKLAHGLGESIDVAKQVKYAYLNAIPGIKELMDELKALARQDRPLITWGGRKYYCEPPKLIKIKTPGGSFEKLQTFEYKMLNTLIQGSAADCTKEGMLNVRQNCTNTRIAVQVHDELLCCVPLGKLKTEVPRIKEAMEGVKFRVPMVTDPTIGRKSWGRLE